MPAGAPGSSKAKWPRTPGSTSRRPTTSSSASRPKSATKRPWASWASAPPCWRATRAMPEETLLAFDYGLKKIGVAVGNTLTRQARPLKILSPVTREQRFAALAALLEEWRPDRVVVGLPLASDGSEQYHSLRCRRFANQLHGRFGVTAELVDERGSSVEAQLALGNHDADDAMAAAIILQRYFDALPKGNISTP